MASNTDVKTLLQTIGDLVTVYSSTQTMSLTEVSKVARVEPLVVVSKDLAEVPYTTDIMQSMLNIFCGYYLQAVSLLNARVENVKVMKILDRLNPDRDVDSFLMSIESLKDIQSMCLESYQYRLPTSSNPRALAMENVTLQRATDGLSEDQDPLKGASAGEAGAGKILMETANLAVGKLLDVKIDISGGKDKDKKDSKVVSIPVSVRLSPTLMAVNAVSSLLSRHGDQREFSERLHAWKSGRISFWKDLVFCQDLIDEERKALMNDKDGVYSEIVRRANNTKKYGLMSGAPSLVSASNIFLISEEVAKNVERQLGGKLSNALIREKAFNSTYAMFIVVVDRDFERVTFYARGIAQGANFAVREIQASNKSKGPDILDVLKALKLGNAPSF
jgi:hypothetical protein